MAMGFPDLNKLSKLDIPWFAKEKPDIDWTQIVMTVKRGQKWKTLPSARPKEDKVAHLAKNISAKQVN